MADGSVVIDIKGDDSKFTSTVRSLGSTANAGLGTATGAANGLEKALGTAKLAAANLMANLATQAVTAAVQGIANAASSVVSTGAAFESAMSKVQALSRASAEDMERLTAKAKEMGSTTKFTATESAEALGYMAMAGWDADASITALPAVLSLAAASGEDLARTSDIVTDAMTALGLKSDEASHFADVLAAAATSANTNVGLMGETFKYVAPLAGAMGMSAEDLAVQIGLMANAGVKGSQAGTSLRSILTRLADPPKDAAAALDALGVSMVDEFGKMKSLDEVMTELRDSFADLDEVEKAQYASAIAGQEAMSGFLAIVNAAPDDIHKVTSAIDGCDGAAEQMAATMNDNLQGQLTLLSSAMDGVALSIYDGVSPALKDVVASVNDSFIPGLQAMVSGSEDAGQKLYQGFTSVFESVLTMVQEFGPRVAEGAVQLVSAAAQGLVSSLPEMITAVVDIASAVVVAIAGEIPNILMAVLEALPEIAHALMENRSTILDAAKNVFTTLAEALPVVLPQILTAIAGVVVELVGGFLSSIPQFVEAGVQIIMGLVGGILSSIPALIGAALDAAGSMLDSVLGFFGIHSPSRKFHWIAEMDMEGMEDGFEDETPGVVRTVRRSMERVYDAADDGGDLWRAMASIGGGAAGSAAQWQAQASMAAQAASASSPAGTSNTWSIGKVVVEAKDAMEASSVAEFFDTVLRRAQYGL